MSVTAQRNGNQIHTLFRYENFDCVGLYTDNSYVYFASRMAQKDAKGLVLDVNNECFRREFEEFYNLLKGEAQSITYEEFVSPVFIMNAIMRSFSSGRREDIRPIQL